MLPQSNNDATRNQLKTETHSPDRTSKSPLLWFGLHGSESFGLLYDGEVQKYGS